MPPSVRVRPLRPDDVAAADLVAYEALRAALPRVGETSEQRARRGRSRIAHLLATDPGGAWAAEAAGRVVGVALALVRDRLWGLSLFAVQPAFQGAGVGRRLLERALAHGGGVRDALVLSSADPRAMRRYARAGFALRPLVAAAGIVDRRGLPPAHEVREGTPDDLPATEAVSRAVRGATHLPDLGLLLEGGARLHLLDDRGFVVADDAGVTLLAARDELAARALLRVALAAAAPGATVQVDFIAAGQDWAVEVLLDAGLSLSPDGPLFVRGTPGPLRPYLPSGAFL